MNNKTSCSDNQVYPAFCELAAMDDIVYLDFRNNPVYTKIVETLSYEWGQQYFQFALNLNPNIINYFDKFLTSEKIGSPSKFTYRYGKYIFQTKKILISPTTIRYIKVLTDLQFFFKDLSNMTIVEIGGGYGGQCKIINDVYKIKKYIIYDLPGPLKLTDRYLFDSDVKNYELRTIDTILNEPIDLIISNYAFSELTYNIQNIYMNEIIKKSNHGYLTCNFNTHTFENTQFGIVDFINKIGRECKVLNTAKYLPKVDLDYKIDLIVF